MPFPVIKLFIKLKNKYENEKNQLTEKETSGSKKGISEELLSNFQSGDLRVLTAKKVLDEGINIPEIRLAFILASTTVERQWVQRRGRLLRKCNNIGKTHAVIHDFVVLPPNALTKSTSSNDFDNDERKMVRSETKRVWEFYRLCRNGTDKDGPYKDLKILQNLANELGVN